MTTHVDFRDSGLSRAELRKIEVYRAHLRDPQHPIGDVRYVDLRHANVREANLSRAQLAREEKYRIELMKKIEKQPFI